MDYSKISELGKQVEVFNDLLNQRGKLNQEFETIKAEYLGAEKDSEQKNILLEQLNSKSKEMSELKDIIATYNINRLEEVAGYIKIVNRHKRISEELQLAIKFSKKEKPKRLYSELITVTDAEGRNQVIVQELVNDFRQLVEEKKSCHEAMRKNYKLIADVDYLYERKLEKEPEIEQPNSFVPPINTDNNAAESEIDYYEQLSDEEKLIETNARLDRIMNARGKKNWVTYNGEKYYIPQWTNGRFKTTKAEQQRLMDKLFPKEIEETPAETPIVPEIAPEDIIVKVVKPKTNIMAKIRKHSKKIIAGLALAAVAAIALTKGFFFKPNQQIKPEQLNTSSIEAQIDNYIGNNPNSEENSIAAANEIAGQVIANFAEPEPVIPHMPENAAEELGDAGNRKITENNLDTDLKLADVPVDINKFITPKEGEPIYKTSYDVKNGTNELKPYFDHNLERQIQGYCYELNGKIEAIYAHDPNFAQQKALLEAQGARLSSYITNLAGVNSVTEFEGFYAADGVENIEDRGRGL